MASNEPPRRVSMAYMLGLSKNPFKEPKVPTPKRKTNDYIRMITTPGAVLEWAASDGRRGYLTGKGKPRLTTNTFTKEMPKAFSVTEATSKKGSNKVASEVDQGIGNMLALFGDGDTGSNAEKASSNSNNRRRGSNPYGFTEEQDKKIMEMKNANSGIPWIKVAEEVGKELIHCKERFAEIKPKDWKPAASQAKKSKGKNQNSQDEQKNAKKKEDDNISNSWDNNDKGNNDGGGDFSSGWGKAEGGSGGGDAPGAWAGGEGADAWPAGGGGDAWVTGGGDDKSWGHDNKKSNTGSAESSNSGGGGGGDAGTVGWEHNNRDNGEWAVDTVGEGEREGKGGGDAWNTKQNNKKYSRSNEGGNHWNNTGGHNDWGGLDNTIPESNAQPVNDGSKRSHHKDSSKRSKHGSIPGSHYSKSRSHSRSTRHCPVEYTISSDDIFSLADCKFIARSLKQEESMVWQNLAWKFKQRTGRYLHPDVFEKKITGKCKGASESNQL